MTITDTVVLPSMFGGASIGDWLDLCDQAPNHKIELIAGELRIMAPGSINHQGGETSFMFWLADTGVDRRCFLPEVKSIIGPGDGYEPDLVVTFEPMGTPGVRERALSAADIRLVIEIASPSSISYDTGAKKDGYQKAGVAHYWVVTGIDDEHPIVHAYRLVEGAYVLSASVDMRDMLSRSVVPFPGW